MPRPAPEKGQEPYTLSFSVPRPMADRVLSEVQPGYGGQAAWFRQVVAEHWDERDVRAENSRLRARVVVLEALFGKVQRLIRDAAA